MLKKVTIYDKTTYYVDAAIPEEEAINQCLEWWVEREPTIDIEGPLSDCEVFGRCPYNHNCSECK